MFVHRRVVYYLRGYDEEYVGWGCEDNDFADRLYECGVPVKNLTTTQGILVIHQYHKKENHDHDEHTKKNRDRYWAVSGLRRNKNGWGGKSHGKA